MDDETDTPTTPGLTGMGLLIGFATGFFFWGLVIWAIWLIVK
jgi:hypothetical protein